MTLRAGHGQSHPGGAHGRRTINHLPHAILLKIRAALTIAQGIAQETRGDDWRIIKICCRR